MKNRTYKDRHLQRMYDACRELSHDTSSELYYNGKPRRGAGHRNAYWDGRSGTPNHKYERGTFAYVCWAAGKDDLRDFGPVEGSTYMRRSACPN